MVGIITFLIVVVYTTTLHFLRIKKTFGGGPKVGWGARPES
jgi:hypothetical protein